MRSLIWLFLMGTVTSLACGARTALREADPGTGGDAAGAGGSGGSGGGSVPAGGGGEGGSVTPDCETVVLSDYALSALQFDGTSLHGVKMARYGGSTTMVCAAGPIQEQAPTTPYGTLCFEAFGAWPEELGSPMPLIGSTPGSMDIAPGDPGGIAVLTGQLGEPFGPPARFARAIAPGEAPSWVDVEGGTSSKAAFLARAKGGGSHIAGLVLHGSANALGLVRLEDDATGSVPSVACAQGQIPADAVYDGSTVIVASGTGADFGACFDDDGRPPGPPDRLQVTKWSFAGEGQIRFDKSLGAVVDDVGIADAGSDVWVAIHSGTTIQVVRVGKDAGADPPFLLVTEASLGPMSIAMRGEELLVAYLDAIDPDLSADVQVVAITPSGEQRSFAGFDTAEAPWVSDISLVVAEDQKSVVVGYHTGPGQLAARRLDCLAE